MLTLVSRSSPLQWGVSEHLAAVAYVRTSFEKYCRHAVTQQVAATPFVDTGVSEVPTNFAAKPVCAAESPDGRYSPLTNRYVPIFRTLAPMDKDGVTLEIDIYHPQCDELAAPESA